MELLHPYLTNVETEVESSYMGYPTLVIECPKKDLNLYLLDFKSSVCVSHFGLAALFTRKVHMSVLEFPRT